MVNCSSKSKVVVRMRLYDIRIQREILIKMVPNLSRFAFLVKIVDASKVRVRNYYVNSPKNLRKNSRAAVLETNQSFFWRAQPKNTSEDHFFTRVIHAPSGTSKKIKSSRLATGAGRLCSDHSLGSAQSC